MLKVEHDSLVVSFSAVEAAAALRVSFRRLDRPDEPVALGGPSDGAFLVRGRGRVVLHLQPSREDADFNRSKCQFAVLISVGGVNALTGTVSHDGLVRPQNYFVTPPQRGVDGFFAGGQVHPFVAWGDPAEDRMPLDLQVFSLKAEVFDHLRQRARFVGGETSTWGCHFALQHGGRREYEPVFEDVRVLGDWDQDHQELVRVWLRGGT